MLVYCGLLWVNGVKMSIMIINLAKGNTDADTDKQACQTRWLDEVAKLERVLLPDDAWGVDEICSSLGQFGAGLMLAVDGADTQIIKGYCIYQIVFETAEIHRIGTHPSYARQGVAASLITALVDEMQHQHSDNLLLEVRADNAPAISLYQKMGFIAIDVRKGYYQTATGRCDAIIMQKQVAPCHANSMPIQND